MRISIYALSILLFTLLMCERSSAPITGSQKENSGIEQKSNESYPNGGLSDTTKVLFIGNSLTYFNNMPNMVQQIAQKAGKMILAESATISGLALRHIVNNTSIHNKIRSNDWDYIILQSDDISAFPDMYTIELNTLSTFMKIIAENNESTKIIYQMIWGLRNGVNVQELNGEFVYYSYWDYIVKIYNGTIYIADNKNLIISPVGWAWRQCRMENPEIELFSSDNAHPSYKGSYLCAAVHYAILFQEDCSENPYNGDLSEQEASSLRSIASSIVLNNLDTWNRKESTGIHEQY